MRGADVVVVGAGPSGCTAALLLARAGVRVVLIDRARFPRDKLCGDTVNPGTLGILGRLGLGRAVAARVVPITGMMVTGPAGACVSADYAPGIRGGAVPRRVLDLMLLEAAVDAGVRFEGGTAARGPMLDDKRRIIGVRGTRGHHITELRARMVIAADGRHSALGFALGLLRFAAPRRWAFGAYFEGVDGLTSRGEMHVRRDGYIGIAPLAGGMANVCVVHDRAQLRAMGPVPASATIERAVRRDPALASRFARARRVTRVSSLGPLGVDSSMPGCAGLLLAGDAAGFIDPLTGDGLTFALRGAELAAQAALSELMTGRPAFRQLARQRRQALGLKYQLNRTLRWVTASPRALGAAETMANWWSRPFEQLVNLAGDVHLIHPRHGEPEPLT